jgi:hypothetical protein
MSRKIVCTREIHNPKSSVDKAFDRLYESLNRVYAPFVLDLRSIGWLVSGLDEELTKAIEQPESINSESLESISGILSNIDVLVTRKQKLQEILDLHKK